MMDQLPLPLARLSDPSTAHHAARIVEPGNGELVEAIRRIVYLYGPLTAWEVADMLYRNPRNAKRWQPDTIRTACARAGLVKHEGGRSPGGRPACLYALEVRSTDAL